MLTPLNPITILHVSDIQFGKNHRFFQHDPRSPDDTFDTLLSRLLEDVRDLKNKHNVEPGLILLTGDLAEWGMGSEFTHVEQFADGLCRGLCLTHDRVVLVPGNHDINRKSCEAYFNECAANEDQPRRPYWPKWRLFTEFFRQFYREHPEITFTEERPYTLFELPSLKIVIAGLNSTIAESHQDADHYGEVGEAQLRWFADQLDRYRASGWLRLAVLHHNIRRGPVQDDENLRDADLLTRILGNRINAVFHGHTHDGKLEWLTNRIPILSTGSAAVKAEARPTEVPAQYQIVQLVPDGLTVFTRAYAPDQRRWIGDTRIGDSHSWSLRELVSWDSVESTFPRPAPSSQGGRPLAEATAETLPRPSINPEVKLEYRRAMVELHQYARFSELAGRAEDAAHLPGMARLPLFVPQHLRPLPSGQPGRLSMPTEKDAAGREVSISVEQLLATQSEALLLGGPGSGKSELTYWILLTLCTGEFQEESAADLLPVRIEMRDFDAEYLRHGEGLGGVIGYAERWLKVRELALHAHLRTIAPTGRLLLLIDGFDEVRSSRRRKLYAEMLLLLHRGTGCRLFVTSRIAGADELCETWPDLPRFVLEEFDDSQVQTYLDAWHWLAFRNDRDNGDRRRSRIARALDLNRAIREIGRNPLLLTLLCMLNRGHELPRRRHQVFQRVIELLADQWEANKDLPPGGPEFYLDDKLHYLRKLGWAMQQDQWEGSSGNRIATEELERFSCEFGQEHLGLEPDAARRWSEGMIADLSTRNQVLSSQGGGQFGVLHRALLEHLAAEGAVRFLTDVQLTDLFRLRWRDGSWREMLTLCCGLLDDWHRQAKIVNGLQATLGDVPLYFGDRQWRAHFAAFAIRCLAEVRQLRQEPMRSLADLIMDLLHQDALAVARTGLWWAGDAEILEALHYFGPRWPRNNGWLAWAQKEEWRQEPDRFQAWPAKCVLATAAIEDRVPRLFSLLTDRTSYFLMKEASQLGPWTVSEAVALCKGLLEASEDVHVHVGCELAASAASSIVEIILRESLHDRILLYVARDSRRSKDPAIQQIAWQTLLNLTGAPLETVRWRAVEWVSGAVSHEVVRSRLRELASDDTDERVRFAAAQALLQSEPDAEWALSRLRGLTGTKDRLVSFWLARVLASHDDSREEARLLLEGLLNSEDSSDRRWAIRELVETLPDARTEALLLQHLGESRDDIRWIHWPASLLRMESLFDFLFQKWICGKHYMEFNDPLVSMTHFSADPSAREIVRRKVELHLSRVEDDRQALNLASWLCHHGLEPQTVARERLYRLAREAREERIRLEAANRIHDAEILLTLARTTQDSAIQGEAVDAYAYYAHRDHARRASLVEITTSASTPAGRLAAAEKLLNESDHPHGVELAQRALRELADGSDEWVRLQAAERLTLRSTLTKLAELATNPKIRQRAVDDLKILDLRGAILQLGS